MNVLMIVLLENIEYLLIEIDVQMNFQKALFLIILTIFIKNASKLARCVIKLEMMIIIIANNV